MLIAISVLMMIFVLWSVWRCIWEFVHIWRFFKKTEFYKAYGDPEEDEEKEES